jgi:type I restriction enzyme S subunit
MAPYVSLTAQRTLQVSLPPIGAQRAIARILGALDDKIELNRKTNETLEAMARALFQSWFVDFDPVRAKMEGRQPEGMDAETARLFPSMLLESESGATPQGWAVAPITTIQAQTKYACVAGPFGSNLTSRDYVERGVPVIRGANLSLTRYWMSTQDFVYVSEQKADELSGNLAFPGDVVLTQRGTLGQVGVVPSDAGFSRYVLSQSQMKIAVDPEAGSPSFVAMYFQQPKIVEFIVGNGQQAGVPHINLAFLRAMRLTLPPAPIARSFERTVGPIFHRVRKIDQQSATLTALRDTLLPKLLSGELRVPEAERAVSKVL